MELKNLINPYILADGEAKTYYLYSETNKVYKSQDLGQWEEVECELPQLTNLVAVKVRNEYRIYGAKEDGIYLYASEAATKGFILRDRVIGKADIDELTLKHSQVDFVSSCILQDPVTHDHFLIYGAGQGGIYSLHINPRNGLAYEDGLGRLIAIKPEFNPAIADGFMIYDEEKKNYCFFGTYGSPAYGSLRMGTGNRPNGIFKDNNGRELVDKNNFEDIIGYMFLGPMLMDELGHIKGYSKPMVFKTFEGQLKLACVVNIRKDKKEEAVFTILDVIACQSEKLPFAALPYSVKNCDKEGTIGPKEITGHYEYIRFVKEVPLAVADYTELSVLGPSENGVSSTRNSWAYTVPHKADGRVELGGSLRGYWVYDNDNNFSIRYNHTTENYEPVAVSLGENEAIFLLGVNTSGQAVMAKKFR